MEWKRNAVSDFAKVHQGDSYEGNYQGPVQNGPSFKTVEDSNFGGNATFQQGNRYEA